MYVKNNKKHCKYHYYPDLYISMCKNPKRKIKRKLFFGYKDSRCTGICEDCEIEKGLPYIDYIEVYGHCKFTVINTMDSPIHSVTETGFSKGDNDYHNVSFKVYTKFTTGDE
jgi:hypothetical protein